MNEWYERASKKLADEKKSGKYDRCAGNHGLCQVKWLCQVKCVINL